MISKYKRDHFLDLYQFLKENKNVDFYITENNIRKFIEDDKDLLTLLRNTQEIFISEDDSELNGVILVWKSLGNAITRKYIKINAINEKIADKLLTVFLWNCNDDLFVKVRKGSKYLNIFRTKGFRFLGNRGNELLLRRYKNPIKIENK